MRALENHAYADWINQNAKELRYVKPNLWLMREEDCILSDEQWRIFAQSFCTALADKEEDEDGGFVIYAATPSLTKALEFAVPGTNRLWVVTMAQNAIYFEVNSPPPSATYWTYFTRFALLHGLSKNGLFEFAAFATTNDPCKASLAALDYIEEGLREIQDKVVDLCDEAQKMKKQKLYRSFRSTNCNSFSSNSSACVLKLGFKNARCNSA